MLEQKNINKPKINWIVILFGVMVLCSLALVSISQNDARFFCSIICEPFNYTYSPGTCTCDPMKYMESFNFSNFTELPDYK